MDNVILRYKLQRFSAYTLKCTVDMNQIFVKINIVPCQTNCFADPERANERKVYRKMELWIFNVIKCLLYHFRCPDVALSFCFFRCIAGDRIFFNDFPIHCFVKSGFEQRMDVPQGSCRKTRNPVLVFGVSLCAATFFRSQSVVKHFNMYRL